MEAAALEGFGELADALGGARRDGPPAEVDEWVAHAFIVLVGKNPALHDAMFLRSTRLPSAGLSPGCLGGGTCGAAAGNC